MTEKMPRMHVKGMVFVRNKAYEVKVGRNRRAGWFTRKRGLAALLLLTLLAPVAGLADINNWQTLTYDSGNVYEGDVKDGQSDGIGKLSETDGDEFIGEWQNGVLEGFSAWRSKTGDQGVSTREKGSANGYSVRIAANGDKFVGQYKDSKLTGGVGIGRYADGRIYMGYWLDGMWSGFGVLIGADGTTWVGEFAEDKFVGKPLQDADKQTIRSANGDVYEGAMQDGKREGYGVQTYADGSVQEGYFKNDMLVKGYWHAKDDNQYVGDFVRGVPHGAVAVLYSNDKKYDIEYVGDMVECSLQGQGAELWPTTNTAYVGGWINDNRAGKGIWFGNISLYIGEFKDSDFNGKGTCYYTNGDIYEGDFMNDKREGRGVLRRANGDVLEGTFKNDEFGS
jgi:hypothetical protein